MQLTESQYIGTTSQEELLIAAALGVDEDYVDKINETEDYACSRSESREQYIETKFYEEEKNQKTKIQKEPLPEKEYILEKFPSEKKAIVIAGGSYNKTDINGNYIESTVSKEDEEILQILTKYSNPEEDIFVIGGRLQGQEKRLVELVNEQNAIKRANGEKEFDIILFTQQLNKMNDEQKNMIENSNIKVIETHQKSELANYKKINSMIFSQNIPADLIVLDGGQAVANLMTDANKDKNSRIFTKFNISKFIDDKHNAFNEEKAKTITKEFLLVWAKDESIQDMNTDMKDEIDKI